MSKRSVTIKDPKLEPFFIVKDENCYTVMETSQSDPNHFRSTGEVKEYTTPLGYYPRLTNAILKISREKASSEDIASLDDYINKINEVNNSLKSFLNELTSKI